MHCREALKRLMEAEPDDLRGIGDSAVAQHLRSCEGCRTVAQTLLEGEDTLGKELQRLAPPLDVAAILERAGREEEERGEMIRLEERRPSWRALGKSLVPFAAAAALALLFFSNGEDLPSPARMAEVEAVSRAQVLEAPEGRNVAVFDTENPSIEVVWFF